MKERPILMNGDMVRAVLDGRKTQTRRLVKGFALGLLQPDNFTPEYVAHQDNDLCPHGKVGDRLLPAMQMPGYDDRYCTDTHGAVWSTAKGQWRRLRPGTTSKGYASITPARDGRYETQLVHRLVCESFYGAPPQGLDQVRHLNGDQCDNAPDNLDWGTHEQNWLDRAAHGRGMGESHHAAKLSEVDVCEIRNSSLSQRALARRYGVAQSTISSVLAAETWRGDHLPAPPNLPRWASRLTLEIVGVRVERLQSISEDDAIAEGLSHHPALNAWHAPSTPNVTFTDPRRAFAGLWASIYGADSWDANPFVWVIEFRPVTP